MLFRLFHEDRRTHYTPEAEGAVKIVEATKRPVLVLSLPGYGEIRARGERPGDREYGVFDLTNRMLGAIERHGGIRAVKC